MRKSTIAKIVAAGLFLGGLFFLVLYPRDPVEVAQKQCEKNNWESCAKLGDLAPESAGNLSAKAAYYARACVELDLSCSKLIAMAIQLNRKNFAEQPDKSPAEALYYSFLAHELGDHQTFVSLARRAACDGNLDPDNCGHAKLLALLADERSFDDRRAEFEDLCKNGELTACHLLGYELLATAQVNEARPYLAKSCDPHGSNLEGCGYLGMLSLKGGNKAEAMPYFEAACTLSAGEIDELACFGQALLSQDSKGPEERLREKCESRESPMSCFLAEQIKTGRDVMDKSLDQIPSCSSGDANSCKTHAITSLLNLDLSSAYVDLQTFCGSSSMPAACGAATELLPMDADASEPLADACEAGDPKACSTLAKEEGEKDPANAENIALRFKSCDMGSVQGCRDVYQALLTARRLFKLDNAVAANALNKFQDKACPEGSEDELCLGAASEELSSRVP